MSHYGIYQLIAEDDIHDVDLLDDGAFEENTSLSIACDYWNMSDKAYEEDVKDFIKAFGFKVYEEEKPFVLGTNDDEDAEPKAWNYFYADETNIGIAREINKNIFKALVDEVDFRREYFNEYTGEYQDSVLYKLSTIATPVTGTMLYFWGMSQNKASLAGFLESNKNKKIYIGNVGDWHC